MNNNKNKEIRKKKYLIDDEIENLKAACETEEERSIVRDLSDTGMRLDEVLKKRARGEVLR